MERLFQVDIPRDRNGEFEPKLIPKYQRDVSGIEEKVISLYARGMSTRDIHDHLQELYGIELSAEMVSKITDKIISGRPHSAGNDGPVKTIVNFFPLLRYKKDKQERNGLTDRRRAMLKLEIKMDEEKIREEKKYRVESIYQALEQAFSRYKFNQTQDADGTRRFTGNGNPKDYGAFGSIITSLKEKAWFMDYVTKWVWYNSDDGESEEDFAVEDVLYHYTKRLSVA